MTFPKIDRTQVQRQLSLLGFSSNHNLYLRFFYSSNDPRKEGDKGRKANRLNWREIENYQRQGRGVYFVINGDGHKNDDVTTGRALFIEHDDLDKDIQRDLWQQLELPQPTFQVDTGGKSIHSYWVFEQPIAIERWCELQRDLLEYSDADRSIKNPARVMRLAGAWHVGVEAEEAGDRRQEAEGGERAGGRRQKAEGGENQLVFVQSRIISESGKKYRYEELRKLIPDSQAQENTLPLLENISGMANALPQTHEELAHLLSIKHPDQIQVPVSAAVPLLNCCRRQVRDWVAAGVPKGSGRNDTAIEVGLELLSVERHLLEIAQPFSDSARQLFTEFCLRSGMSQKEDEERWQWCSEKTPTPSCGSDGIASCIRGWYWRTQVKPAKQQKTQKSHQISQASTNGNQSTVTGDSTRSSDTAKLDQLNVSATVATVTTVLQSGLIDYEERAELDAIQQRSLISKGAFWELVASVRCALDEVQPEDVQRLEQLLDWHDAKLDLHQVLPAPLAQTFEHDAEILNIDPISLWQYFLPAALSLIGKRVNLDVESHIIPAICWTCIVAESGTGKSRAENVVLAHLKSQQIQERQAFITAQKEYRQLVRILDKDDPEPDAPANERKYLFEVATIQALMRRLSEQRDNGSLWARDELAGVFKSLGQFSKGSNDNEGVGVFIEDVGWGCFLC